MQIIRCDESHLEELMAVAKQCFIDAFEKHTDPENFNLYVNKSFERDVVLEELQNPQAAFFFLKTDAGETAGYLKVRWDRSEEFFPTEKALELQRIYLLEPFWNKGYGKVLLDFAENFGATEGYAWIWLIVWFKNEGAVRFYEREGWEKFGRKNFQFGNQIHNDFAMRKPLILK